MLDKEEFIEGLREVSNDFNELIEKLKILRNFTAKEDKFELTNAIMLLQKSRATIKYLKTNKEME